MLSKLRQKKQEGFTIIEVLIVLAIAGLILLVVFLAVPALQRNSRNTQRDNDFAGILAGMSEYVNNNNGQLPSVGAFSSDGDGSLTIGGADDNTVDVNLGFYLDSDVTLQDFAAGNPTPDDGQVVIVTGALCNDQAQAVDGPSRAYVARYEKEVGSEQCRES